MDKYGILKTHFGYDAFREGQEALIDSILQGRDVLGIMPTGAGKSLCYQIPALLLPGVTLVISPLISLMKDQVQALNQAGIHAAYINSSLSEGQIEKALRLAAQGQYKIIYVAPERLETAGFLQFALHAKLSMLTVDEAHCISQWGQDFRPSYLKIVQFIQRLSARPILSAFTATATEAVRRDITRILELASPHVLLTGFDRENLYFAVKTPKRKETYVRSYVLAHPGDSGIIYCATRKNVEAVCELLSAADIPVTRYHAGLSSEERRQNQDDFIYDKKPVIVATNAFGMGIDKSNVRYVLHYNMPQSMENYYQEAGRAGRDGESAECILLYSPQDLVIGRLLLNSKEPGPELTEAQWAEIQARDKVRLRAMERYCKTTGCLREYILHYFGESERMRCENCGNCRASEETDFAEEAQAAPIPRAAKRLAGILNEKGQQLFEALRALRLELAREESVPPYVIFSDKTLTHMCMLLPFTEKELLQVSGVGAHKSEKYGARFLSCIRAFCNGKKEKLCLEGLEEPAPFVQKKAEKKAPKEDFSLRPELAEHFPYRDRYLLTELAAAMSELRDMETIKKITGAEIFRYLTSENFLEEKHIDGHWTKIVSEKGAQAGIFLAPRMSKAGAEYLDAYYDEKAQRMIVAHYTRAGE